MEIDKQITQELKELINDLVNKEYRKIVVDERNGEMPEEVISEIIEDYGGTLTVPPEKAFEQLDIIQVDNKSEYSIVFDLWMDNRKSDLSLICTAIVERENVSVVIEDIHVL